LISGSGVSVLEDDEKKPVKYFIFFRSPTYTWRALLGVSGTFVIDATSLKQIDFEIYMIS